MKQTQQISLLQNWASICCWGSVREDSLYRTLLGSCTCALVGGVSYNRFSSWA